MSIEQESVFLAQVLRESLKCATVHLVDVTAETANRVVMMFLTQTRQIRRLAVINAPRHDARGYEEVERAIDRREARRDSPAAVKSRATVAAVN